VCDYRSFRLRKHSLDLADIGFIIHRQVHMDHAGQDYLLPNARILVQCAELRNAAAPDIYPVPFYDRLKCGQAGSRTLRAG
jgi:hypothetical protein